MSGNEKAIETKRTDAQFLIDEFDISVPKAAELVADDAVSAEAVFEDVVHQPAPDALAGVPVPNAPAKDFIADVDEEPLKPVLHTPNLRRGA